jgi:hypothetical protein
MNIDYEDVPIRLIKKLPITKETPKKNYKKGYKIKSLIYYKYFITKVGSKGELKLSR